MKFIISIGFSWIVVGFTFQTIWFSSSIAATDQDITDNEHGLQIMLNPSAYPIQDNFKETRKPRFFFPFNGTPELLYFFDFLDITNLGKVSEVCKQWRIASLDSIFWEGVGLREYGEYLTEGDLKNNPKKQIIYHYLAVSVNALEDLQKIGRIVQHYELHSYGPCVKICTEVIKDIRDREEFIAQGNQDAIKRKLDELCGLYSYGNYAFEKNLEAAREFNDFLVDKGNQEAICIKLKGLSEGMYGYEKNPEAAKEFNDFLVDRGDARAIRRKIEALWHGGATYSSICGDIRQYGDVYVEEIYPSYGYEKNPEAAKEFNDSLLDKGYQEAFEIKFEGLNGGKYGYEKNLEAAKEINDLLADKGDVKATRRRISEHGNKRNFSILRQLINSLFDEEGLYIWEKYMAFEKYNI